MTFRVDANLPNAMVDWFIAAGHQAMHVIALPDQEKTSDAVIMATADDQQSAIVTRDRDFVHSFQTRGIPAKLLWISLGNVRKQRLRRILEPLIDQIANDLKNHDFVELSHSGISIRS